MKAKRLIIFAAVLFALSCGESWNPVAPPPPAVNPYDGSGRECNERLYPGLPVPPHCESLSSEHVR